MRNNSFLMPYMRRAARNKLRVGPGSALALLAASDTVFNQILISGLCNEGTKVLGDGEEKQVGEAVPDSSTNG